MRSGAVITSSAAAPVFELHDHREQQVVLLVDVKVRVGFELSEPSVARFVRGTRVDGRSVPLGQLPQPSEERPGTVVLDEHDGDGVLHGSAVEARPARWRPTAPGSSGTALAPPSACAARGRCADRRTPLRPPPAPDGARRAHGPTFSVRSVRRGSSAQRYRWWVDTRWPTSSAAVIVVQLLHGGRTTRERGQLCRQGRGASPAASHAVASVRPPRQQ